MKDKLIEILKLMENEDLLLIKGQLLRPEPRQKQDQSGYYIVFEMKVVKDNPARSKYDTQFSSYTVIVPSQNAQLMAPVLKNLKEHEVLVVATPSARIRKGTQGGKFNSIDLYLHSIYDLSALIVHNEPLEPLPVM